MKLLILSLLFIPLATAAQSSRAVRAAIPANTLEGAWERTHTDSVFGHKTTLKITFTKTKAFMMAYFVDEKITEKHQGNYAITQDNLIRLMVKNKPVQQFTILRASSDSLLLKAKGEEEILQLIRAK